MYQLDGNRPEGNPTEDVRSRLTGSRKSTVDQCLWDRGGLWRRLVFGKENWGSKNEGITRMKSGSCVFTRK